MSENQDYFPYIFCSQISVPINEINGGIQPLLFETQAGNCLLAFSSAVFMAEFFEGEVEFMEMAPRAVLAMAREGQYILGFDLGQGHGVLLDFEAQKALLHLLEEQEGLSEETQLELVEFSPDALLQNEIARILDPDMRGFLAMDAQLGLVLILVISAKAKGEGWQSQFRQNLLRLEGAERIHVLMLPAEHSRFLQMEADLARLALEIEPVLEERAAKPPILR